MKLTPKKFTAEELQAVVSESAVQTPRGHIEKSADPKNYPVFEVPVNEKVLVYVPNHTVVNADGVEELKMDKPWIHTVVDGKQYRKYRCIRNLTSGGYSGSCPLCEGAQGDPWDLANAEIKEQCEMRGLDPNDTENEAVKSIKRDCYSKRVIKSPEQFYTFPIVILETDPQSQKLKILTDENGFPKHCVKWYTISKSAYDKKWRKILESMEDEPTHPGGEVYILDYTYESKNGDYNKRDSARNLLVTNKKIKDFANIAVELDKETEGWDQAKAIETIYDNMYYDEDDLVAEANRILAGTRDKLAIYRSAKQPEEVKTFSLGTSIGGAQLPDVEDDLAGALPMAGEVDE